MREAGDLSGVRVALLESRFGPEMVRLVERYGGEAVCAPSVREQRVESPAEVAALIDGLGCGDIQTVIFFTGVGTAALFEQAAGLGRRAELVDRLARAAVVARGPKPASALREAGVPVTISVSEPYTTTDVLAALTGHPLAGQGVAIIEYGERNEALAGSLRGQGANLTELCLYAWELPADRGPLERLTLEMVAGRFDALAVTSQIQTRHLFLVATDLGCTGRLQRALNSRVIVAAVGPTCAAGLESLGVLPRVVPAHPKMGHLVRDLAAYFADRRSRTRAG